MNKRFLCSIILIGILFFGGSVEIVMADAWWGEGYRSPEWVLNHGGTTIRYVIKGTSHPRDYKAVMFKDGKYVEVEFGKHAIFDDAKNGTYLINFYKCRGGCMHQKYDKKTKIRPGDKKVAAITIVARPGEANNLIFNANNNTIELLTHNQKNIKKVDSFVLQKKIAQKNEGLICNNIRAQVQKMRLEQFLFLTNKVDKNKFRSINKNVGILPTFITKNNI